jgi:nucleoside-diphosphate-sugar epimerase
MRIAITGATGNLGTALIRCLTARGEGDGGIVGIARRRPEVALPAPVTVRAIDIGAPESAPSLVDAFAGCDVVFHLAWAIQPSHRLAVQQRTNVVGTERVLSACAAAAVPSVVVASSLAAYSRRPGGEAVSEWWPTHGLASSSYSWQKAYCERLLDRFELERPQTRVVRMRPSLIFQGTQGAEIRRLFLGPLVSHLVPPGADRLARLLPHPFQVVHADDCAAAFRLAGLDPGARGPFNVAGDPVLGRRSKLEPGLRALRVATDLAWKARILPADPGWIDMLRHAPLLDTTRIRADLGWKPVHSSVEALSEMVDGLRAARGAPTPPLHADRDNEVDVRDARLVPAEHGAAPAP